MPGQGGEHSAALKQPPCDHRTTMRGGYGDQRRDPVFRVEVRDQEASVKPAHAVTDQSEGRGRMVPQDTRQGLRPIGDGASRRQRREQRINAGRSQRRFDTTEIRDRPEAPKPEKPV